MRVLVAMSGGVDSSVVAGLLTEQGHEVVGATLQLYDHGAAAGRKGARCAGRELRAARRAGARGGAAGAPAAPGRTSTTPAASPTRSASPTTCWTGRRASAAP